MADIKTNLKEIALSVLKGIKILLTYILPSILIVVLASPELQMLIQGRLNVSLPAHEVLLVVAIVNSVLVTVVDLLKKVVPQDMRLTLDKVL